MHPLEPFLIAALALLFFGLALSLILDTTQPRRGGSHNVAARLESVGGPWPWIAGFTLCGCMGAARALAML